MKAVIIVFAIFIFVPSALAGGDGNETYLDGFNDNPQMCYPLGNDIKNDWKRPKSAERRKQFPKQWEVALSCSQYTEAMLKTNPDFDREYLAVSGGFHFAITKDNDRNRSQFELLQSSIAGGDYILGTGDTKGWKCTARWDGTTDTEGEKFPSGVLFCQTLCCAMKKPIKY